MAESYGPPQFPSDFRGRCVSCAVAKLPSLDLTSPQTPAAEEGFPLSLANSTHAPTVVHLYQLAIAASASSASPCMRSALLTISCGRVWRSASDNDAIVIFARGGLATFARLLYGCQPSCDTRATVPGSRDRPGVCRSKVGRTA
jgi:hypothetical protein